MEIPFQANIKTVPMNYEFLLICRDEQTESLFNHVIRGIVDLVCCRSKGLECFEITY